MVDGISRVLSESHWSNGISWNLEPAGVLSVWLAVPAFQVQPEQT
jgi:hypothetical protein